MRGLRIFLQDVIIIGEPEVENRSHFIIAQLRWVYVGNQSYMYMQILYSANRFYSDAIYTLAQNVSCAMVKYLR